MHALTRNGLACFDRTVASQPIELEASVIKAIRATTKSQASRRKTEKRSSHNDRDKHHLATKKSKSTLAAAKVEPPASVESAQPFDPLVTVVPTKARRRWKSPRPMTSVI
jgi:hypothetical protein